MHDFLVWLRTSSNPADINRFLSHTAKKKNISKVQCEEATKYLDFIQESYKQSAINIGNYTF